MSLQVWLPLNRDLRNQGLDKQVTINGGTIDDNGKLGKCYLITKTNPIIVTQSISATSEWTVNFWAKLPSSMNNATAWETMFSFPTINADTGANSTSNISWASYHNVKIWDDANHQWFWASPSTHFNYDKWHMWTVAHTANGSGVTGKIYIDGNLIGTYNNTTHQMKIRPGSITIGAGISTGGFYINDFRIYDHCLSPMEVKELSKGLMLHYPLNRGGWGQENFILESHKVTGGGQASGITRTYESDGSMKIVSTSGNGNWCSLLFAKDSNTSVGNNMVVGDVYCISCDVKVETGTALPTLFINSGNGYKQLKPVGGSIVTGKWMRIYYTSTWSDPGTGYGNITLHLGFSGIAGTYYFKNFKLEKGSVPTPWCPNSSDDLATTMGLNGTIEYDCSGYCNNGSKMTNTMTYTSDTAKYQVSTHFNGTYDGILIENLQLSDIINTAVTYAFWIKPEGESGARSIYFGSFSANSWSIEKNAGNVLRLYWNGSPDETCSGATITDGVWQHICITKSGINDVKVYVNGEQKWNSTAAHNNLSFPTTYRIGRDTRSNDGTPYKGLMSDFRIYATALSADDVKSLYQNR